MKDKSIDQDERFFDAYVFTYDENPNPSVKPLSDFKLTYFQNFFPRVCLHDYARQKLQKKELFKSMEAMMEYLPLKVGIEY